VSAPAAVVPPAVAVRPAGRQSVARQAVRLWRTRIGLGLLALLVLLAIVGPYLAPYGPSQFVGAPNSPPAGKSVFGTDYLGQDVLSRFLDGERALLVMAVLATALALVVGVVIGLVAAYSRNALDDTLMRLMDVILAFPQIVLALLAVTLVGPHAWVIVTAIALTTVPRVARVTRGAAQPVIERDFVASAEAMGVGRARILLGEVLPNVLSPLMVEASLRLTYSVGVIAALAFLGLAPNPNGANWGTMIQENQLALSTQPWGTVLPVIALALLTMATGLIGDGIARAAAGIDRVRAD